MVLEVFVFFVFGLSFQLSVFYSHPLVLGMGLLIFSVFMGMVICYYGPIFSFCAFMVMVAGVLVVFSYTISLVPFEGYNYEDKKDLKKKTKIFEELGISRKISGYLGALFFFLACVVSPFVNSDNNEDVSGMFLSYTEISYFTEDYSLVVVWLAVLLFLAMVFSASMSKWYEGALVQ
uniref:NADH dehydrogenase subunit 6 n=1 Tax=Meretrix meretrix TaxID=291251 RepID=C8CP72_MERMT|nr:NADH dehydrogenase subunit 6 [Meretrix meretrix]ACU68440.1 NADH dehydrogenase subunit 6 [Meretrix meretrix]